MFGKLSFFIFLISFMVSGSVQATQCAEGELMLEFTHMQAHVKEDYTVVIEGILQMPTPGYDYTLEMDVPAPDQIARGILSFYKEQPDQPSLTVITPMVVEKTIEIPKGTMGVSLTVVKTFDWGPEHFSVKFPEGFGGSTILCMSPEMNK